MSIKPKKCNTLWEAIIFAKENKCRAIWYVQKNHIIIVRLELKPFAQLLLEDFLGDLDGEDSL